MRENGSMAGAMSVRGSNASFPGGTVKAPIHLDGIIANPTIYLDGEVILSQGQFRI